MFCYSELFYDVNICSSSCPRDTEKSFSHTNTTVLKMGRIIFKEIPPFRSIDEDEEKKLDYFLTCIYPQDNDCSIF